MSDYSTFVGINRDQMVAMLHEDTEHLAYVLLRVMQGIDVSELEIDLYDIDDVEEVISNLRQLADMAHAETS